MASTSSASMETVMSFRVNLKYKPLVWRRILVPRDYTFKDLSVAINSAMGWSGRHLHQYSFKHPRINKEVEIPGFGSDFGDSLRLPETTMIAKIFTDPKLKVKYNYDLGFPWTHHINWEKDVPTWKGEKYPMCTGGRMVSPPEDDPGPGYSYSDEEQNFCPSNVDMSKCRQVIMGMPKENTVTGEKVTNPTAKSSEAPVLKESNSQKNELTSEINAPAAKRKIISFEIPDPSNATSLATLQDVSVNSSSPAAKRRLIASPISAAASTVTSKTVSIPVVTAQDVPNNSSSAAVKRGLIASQISAAASTGTSKTVSGPVVTAQDVPNNSSSAAAKRGLIASRISSASTDTNKTVVTTQDVPINSSSPVANGILITSQISAASTVIGDTISSPVATVQDELDDSSSSSIQSHMKKETDQDIEDMYGKYIASQMRLVPDLEAREDMRCDIQSVIKKYRFQKK